MRNPARWAATLGLTATAVCGPLIGTAQAAPATTPASLYAPSALVFTIGHGESAAGVTPERAVTLSCAPTPSGTHPDAVGACLELRGANGNLEAIESRTGVWCTRQYDPVVVRVSGVWQGEYVDYERTFSNECVKNSYGTSVFAF
ncbi:protease inhibitor protein [Streptomyces sp. AS58]|uniref:Probable subtilase-type protease inhibitor n=1 Tax=Streptomyces cadmiisoli TaxID=2184053 RepID=A0A2Z4ITS0_9ACTN|nr:MULTISPECIES: subtilase-type protease inhibitor [Streptomyces]AWW36245.1 protease inhibitor protein [Streptomyces cadmiisoli]KOV72103.1 protease inhibitor protein [Streptomyces sp. AS58]